MMSTINPILHPRWNGPINAAGKEHGTSVTEFGTEHMQNGLLHDLGDQPAQTSILGGGEIAYSHCKMGLRCGEYRVMRNGVTVLRELWSMGYRHGPSYNMMQDGRLFTKSWVFGALHGVATETDNDGRITCTTYQWGRPVTTTVYPPHSVYQQPPVPAAVAALVELSESASDSSDPAVNNPIPRKVSAEESLAAVRAAAERNKHKHEKIPRSRVVRDVREEPRAQREKKVPARYRSSHY